MKPSVIWCSENPGTFERINQHTLPVYHRSAGKSWMTQLLFPDALLNCYASKLKNNTPFKILLIVHNAPRYPFIGDLHLNIKVVFHHPNSIPSIQQMDQGAIAAFKSFSLMRTSAQAIAAAEEDTDAILQELPHLQWHQEPHLGLR